VTASLVGLLREGLLLVLLLAAPLLVAAVIAGVLSGLLAAFTQIQDPSVALAPRVAAVAAAIALFAPAIAHQLVAFVDRIWPMIAAIGTG
jgi:flagellar biosynthetic protein FliQ